MYRQFFLINGNQDRYDLTNKNFKHFLNTPQGLGFVNNISTLRLGNSETITSQLYSMPQPQGELLFYDQVEQAYQDYDEFIEFISHKPIQFHYLPPNTLTSHYIDCEVMQVDKSEVSQDGILHCPIIFYGTSLWKSAEQTTIILTNELVGDGKTYPLERPYSYGGSSLDSIKVNVGGNIPIGFTFEINGECTNPQLSATKDGETYGIIKLLGTFDYVRINTNDTEQEIYLEADDVPLANPMSYQDFSVADGKLIVTFFKLLVGESELTFTSGNIDTFDGNITLRYKDEKVSV